jgi:hypothetical protein
VKLPWSREDSSTGLFGRPERDSTDEEGQKCPGLAKILEKILREDKPEILDLGPFCGATAVYLADRGARVSVEGLEVPSPLPKPPGKPAPGKSPAPEAPAEPAPPFRLDQPDGKFHLALVWEVGDFFPAERLPEFGKEIHRVLVDGGWALLLSISDPPKEGHAARRPPRYRVVQDDQVVREPNDGPAMKRYGHNPRQIERALAPLAVQGIHLQRNQLREFLLFKRAATG